MLSKWRRRLNSKTRSVDLKSQTARFSVFVYEISCRVKSLLKCEAVCFCCGQKQHLTQYLIFTRTVSLPLVQSNLLPSQPPTLFSQRHLIRRVALCHTCFLMRGFLAQDEFLQIPSLRCVCIWGGTRVCSSLSQEVPFVFTLCDFY